MGNDYSSYINEGGKIPPNISVIYAKPLVFFGINLTEEIINGIQNVYLDVWKKAILKVKYYNTNIVKFVPHKSIMFQGANSENSAKSKQMFCRFHKFFCMHGWSLSNSPTLTFEWSLSTWIYFKDLNPYMVDTGALDNEFCAISLSGFDRFQFIDLPQNLENGIIECLKNNWSRGIHEKEIIESVDNAWTIELKGNPWKCSGEESISARFLVLSLIRFMSHKNWRLVNSTAMKPDASDTMFFRNFLNAFNDICPETFPEYYFMLALMGTNYFSVLGANEDIKKAVASSCARHEEKGIKPVETKKNFPAIIMNSDVWSRRNEYELFTKRLMTLLFQDLASIGWLPVESIDCTRSIHDLSSLVFVSIPPVRMMFFSLSPLRRKRICLINAPDDVQSLIYDIFVTCYPIKKKPIQVGTYGIASTITFSGNPFSGFNNFGTLLFQQTLAIAIDGLKNIGWNLVLSADTSNETRTRGSGSNSREVKYSIYSLWFGKVLPF